MAAAPGRIRGTDRKLKIARRVENEMNNVFGHYYKNSWVFDDSHLRELDRATPPELKERFSVELVRRDTDIIEYGANVAAGLVRLEAEQV